MSLTFQVSCTTLLNRIFLDISVCHAVHKSTVVISHHNIVSRIPQKTTFQIVISILIFVVAGSFPLTHQFSVYSSPKWWWQNPNRNPNNDAILIKSWTHLHTFVHIVGNRPLSAICLLQWPQFLKWTNKTIGWVLVAVVQKVVLDAETPTHTQTSKQPSHCLCHFNFP